MTTNQDQPNQLPGFADDAAEPTRGWRSPPVPDTSRPLSAGGAVSPNRRMYTITEAAELLGIGRSTAYELAQRGELDVVHIGGRRLVSPSVLEGLLGERPPPPFELVITDNH